MGEDLFDRPGQPAPTRDDRGGAGRPRRPGLRRSRACQAARPSRREAHARDGGERERRRRSGRRRTPRPPGAVWPSPRRGAGRRSGFPVRNAAQSGASGHKGQSGLRGRQIVAPISISAWAKSPALSPGASVRAAVIDFAPRPGDRLIEREEARQDAGDIAVDRRGLASEGDRRDRRGGIGADAGEGAQIRLLARKSPAAPSDFLGAGVQVTRPRIVAEARERANHRFDRGGGQILDPRPFGDEDLDSRASPPGPSSAAAALRRARRDKDRGSRRALRARRARGDGVPTIPAFARQSRFALPRSAARLHWRSCN